MSPEEHFKYMQLFDKLNKQLFAFLLHNSTVEGRKIFEQHTDNVAQAWKEIEDHAPEAPRAMLQSMLRSLIEGKFFPAGVSDTGVPQFDQWRHTQSWRCNLRNMFNLRRDLQVLVNKLPEDERATRQRGST